MKKSLSYSDVYLVPKYSNLRSRSEADISVSFLGKRFKAPWIPANMESVIDQKTAKWLSENDYPYIYHRFGDTVRFIEDANFEKWKLISISVGVKEEDKKILKWICSCGYMVDWINIDIAHGDSVLMKEMIDFIKSLKFKSCLSPYRMGFTSIPLEYKPKIIAGNIATHNGVANLASWGADAAKVGIAGGHACSTKNMTGFHIPMFSCVEDCSKNRHIKIDVEKFSQNPSYFYPPKCSILKCQSEIPIIADGGIRENGDISKALVAGATMVMAGSMFAACIDAPGENVHKNAKIASNGLFIHEEKGNTTHKKYHGSASAKQKGERKHVEGFELEIPCNGLTYAEKYQELTESLQSSISYAGGKDLNDLKLVETIRIK